MLLKPREVAARLSVSLSTVYGLVESGKLACHRIGRRRGAVRVSEDDLRDYLASCHREVGTEPRNRSTRKRLKHVHL